MNIKNEPWKPDDMANRPGGLTVDHTVKKMSVNAREVGLDYEPDEICTAKDSFYCGFVYCQLNGECKYL